MSVRTRFKAALAAMLPGPLQRLGLRAALGVLSSEERDAAIMRYEIASMPWSLRNLRDMGFSPTSVLDIGACSGGWTTMIVEMFPAVRVLMVEARPEQEADLRRTSERYGGRVSYAIALLGAAPATAVEFFVTSGGTGSSVLPENSDIPRAAVRLPMTTVDGLLAARHVPSPSFIKLDVQGYELEILRGAPRALGGAEVVLMEVALWPYNEGAPLFAEVTRFMDEQGFRLFDICSLIRRPQDRVLLQTDAIFVRRDSRLLQATTTAWH